MPGGSRFGNPPPPARPCLGRGDLAVLEQRGAKIRQHVTAGGPGCRPAAGPWWARRSRRARSSGPPAPGRQRPAQGEQVRSLEVMGCEGVHRVAASGKQAPGQGPWPGELTSASYGFRWMRGTASMAMMRTMGGSLR
jgi:hypothetical protein